MFGKRIIMMRETKRIGRLRVDSSSEGMKTRDLLVFLGSPYDIGKKSALV